MTNFTRTFLFHFDINTLNNNIIFLSAIIAEQGLSLFKQVIRVLL